jgi:hypothetical protein
MGKKILIAIIVVALSYRVGGQDMPVSFRHEAVYDFIDEMANCGYANINSAARPWSVKQILLSLEQVEKYRGQLSSRQQRELDFYLKQYSFFDLTRSNPYTKSKRGNLLTRDPNFNMGFLPPGLHYRDSCFTFSLRPIWGIREYLGGVKNIRHTWGGAEAQGSIGRVSIYASLRDNYQTEILSNPTYFTPSEGGNYKVNVQGRKGGDYSEMRGGVLYGWKWGSIGLVKDQLQWGTSYHGSSIFSGRNPSFAMIRLSLNPVKWFELNYIHGWLVSEVVDSTRSYTTSNGDFRKVYRDKYIAANLLTFKPLRGVAFSVGNSIVYSDMKVQPAYLIPVMFFKSIDHTLNHNTENQNSQMFLDISFRTVRHLHLYGTLFIDDFSVTRIGDASRQNFVGRKAGIRLSDWPLRNVSVTGEFIRTNPIVYKHRVPTTTFETNRFNLGHYLRDNSEEVYGAVDVKPFRGVLLRGEVVYARHGNEYAYTDGNLAELLPYMQDVTWQNLTYSLTARWEFINDSWLVLSVTQSDIKGYDVDGKPAQYYLDLYTPPSFQGENTIVTLGLNFGF